MARRVIAARRYIQYARERKTMADENNTENMEEQTTETVNDPTPPQVDGGGTVEQPESEHDTVDTANIEPRLDALEKSFAELKFMFETLGFSPAENTENNDGDNDETPSIEDLFNED